MIAPQAGTKIMRALDLFCCAGGAGMGLHRAGFDVVGVDINPQPIGWIKPCRAQLERDSDYGNPEWPPIHPKPRYS